MEFRQAYDPVRALGGAWRLVARAPLTMIVGAVLVFLTDPQTPQGVQFENGHPSWWGALLVGGVAVSCCCVSILVWLFSCLLYVGLAGAVQRVLTTGEERFSDLFQPRGLFGEMVLARLVKVVLLVATFLPTLVIGGGPVALGYWLELEWLGWLIGSFFALAYLPIFVYILLGLLLVEEAVAFESRQPFDALKRSWDLAAANRMQLLWFGVVNLAVSLAGLLCLCFGVLVTAPWARLAWFESYARFVLPAPEGGFPIDRETK